MPHQYHSNRNCGACRNPATWSRTRTVEGQTRTSFYCSPCKYRLQAAWGYDWAILDGAPNSPTTMSLLSLALGLAHAGHAGQFRNDGTTPYITHPVRIGQMVSRLSPRYQAAAVIHDVAEDNKALTQEAWFQLFLDAGIDPVVVEAVKYLTRHEGDSYAHFIERIIGDEGGLGHTEGQRIAAMVKAVDILDNLLDNPSPTKIRLYVNSLKLIVRTFPEVELNFARCSRPSGDGSLLEIWSAILVTEDIRLDHLHKIKHS